MKHDIFINPKKVLSYKADESMQQFYLEEASLVAGAMKAKLKLGMDSQAAQIENHKRNWI